MDLKDSELERLARELHEEWDSPWLWPRIQAKLIADKPRRKTFPLLGQVFAAAAVLVLSVALAQFLPKRASQPVDADFLTRGALFEVERSEAAYARSIEKLSAIARPTLQASSTPLAAAYREKLVILDAAITDLKESMDANPYSSYLRNELASLYRDKQLTLEEWLKNAKNN
jgi:hypothetical protein